MNIPKRFIAAAAMVLVMGSAQGAFNYNDRDLLLVFRQSGKPNLEVNIGSVSNYVNASPGATIPLNGFSSTQFDAAWDTTTASTNPMTWAVVGGGRVGMVDASFAPDKTIWVTKARNPIDIRSAPVPRQSGSTQGAALSKINGLAGLGSTVGVMPWSIGTPYDAQTNATYSVLISESDSSSYRMIAGTLGSLGGTYWASGLEAPVTASGLSRADFYQVQPATGSDINTPGTYLGYFELNSLTGTMLFHRYASAAAQLVVGANIYNGYRTDMTNGTWVYVDADPAGDSPVRATQRSLGFREVSYKDKVPATLYFSPVTPSNNAGTVIYNYTAQANKTNLVGFWASKDVPMIIGPDGLAYITDGHHTTAGYMSTNSPVRQMIPGMNRVILGHIVANYYNPAVGPQPLTDDWWLARAAENNAFLYGPNGDMLTLPGDPNYGNLQPILPSVQPMPTTPSAITANGVVAMQSSIYRGLMWGLADGIVVSATDAGAKKIAGYKKAAPGSSVDINFVEFFWSDFLRNRIVWDDTKAGSTYDSSNGDANVTAAPLSFFTAVANGIALARSEAYQDEHGRYLWAYTNSALFPPVTVNWANGSLSNGLALATDTYNLYLRDDSSIAGDITPSALSKNILHIDTASSLVVTNTLYNLRSVIVNAGGTLKTSWKDATVSNSTLTLPAGTGTVLFNGVMQGGAVQVAGGSLSGNGVINGSLLVQNGGALAPGASIGTLTVNGPVTLAGTTLMEINKIVGTLTNDRVTGITTLIYGGTLTLATTGDELVAGDSFKLFDAADYRGFFGALNLPTLTTGLYWDYSRLLIDGSIQVTTEVAPLAGNVTLGTMQGQSVSVSAATLLANDTDTNGYALSLFTVSPLSVNGGTVTLAAENVTYTPAPFFAGMDLFTYTITNTQGAAAVGSVLVTVSNLAPSVTLVGPANATLSAPARVVLIATGADSDDRVAKLQVFEGTTKLGESASSPLTVTLNNVGAGTHTYSAVVTDLHGVTTNSSPVQVVVTTNNLLPLVQITSPTNGESFAAPGNYALTVSASDLDGYVTKVELYRGAIKLGALTSAPWSIALSNQPVGSLSYTAVATDNQGATVTSTAIIVTVGITSSNRFSFSDRNLLLAFRQAGKPNLEVNIGSVSDYVNLSPGSTIPVTGFTPEQLGMVWDSATAGANPLNWAVVGGGRIGMVDTALAPDKSVWVTKARVSLDLHPLAATRQSGSTQGAALSKINGLAGLGSTVGLIPWSAGTPFDAVTNNAVSVIINESDSSSYRMIAGTLGNLGGAYWTSGLETPVSATGITRADLYQVQPATNTDINTPGQYLGYFELDSANGTMIFKRYDATPLTVTPINVTKVVTNSDNSIAITLPVHGADGTLLSYLIVSQPGKGNVTVNGNVLTYLPVGQGADSFTYAVTDGIRTSAPATVSLNIQNRFTFADRDLLLAFRQAGKPNLEVNIGSVSNYVNAAPGTTIPVTGFTPSQLAMVWDSVTAGGNPLNWAVVGGGRIGMVDTAFAADKSVWVTKARVALDVHPQAVSRQSGSSQGAALSKINGLAGLGSTAGLVPWSLGTPFDVVTNNLSSVIINESDSSSYKMIAGTLGNLGGSYWASGLETPVSALGISRADLYQVQPATGSDINSAGQYLGYFELDSANGTMVFKRFDSTPLTVAPINVTKVVTNSDNTIAIMLPDHAADGTLLSYIVIGQPGKGSVAINGNVLTYLPVGQGADSFTYAATDGIRTSAPATVSLNIQNRFTFADRDLLLAFRQAGKPNLEVNIGSVSNYVQAPLGTVIQVANISLDQLALTWNPLIAASTPMNWAVLGAGRVGLVDTSFAPDKTVWVTKTRGANQSSAVSRQSASTQGAAVSKINALAGLGSTVGLTPWSLGTPYDALTNNLYSAIVPPTDSSSYAMIAGALGDLGGTYWSSALETAVAASTVTRADLYEARPATGVNIGSDAEYIGYFELDAVNGTLVFYRNHAPTATDIAAGNVLADTTTTIALQGSDVDGNPLAYQIVTGPLHGTVELNGNVVHYTSAAGFAGLDSFTYVVSDGASASSVKTVSIMVQPQLRIVAAKTIGGLLFSWPANAGGFVLQSATTLTPPADWQTVTDGIATDADVNTYGVTNHLNAAARYFRLIIPQP